MKKPRLKLPRKSARRLPVSIPPNPFEHGAMLERIESKLDLLVASTKVTIPAFRKGKDDLPELRPATITQKSMERCFQALRTNRKIEAIREVRAMLGIGLKEAKDLCEQHFFEFFPSDNDTQGQ